jgi:hypothetical protein
LATWDAEFSNGPIVIPAGTVFNFAGHIIGGNVQDPKDYAHYDGGRKGISPAEIERRQNLLLQDMAIDPKNTSAVSAKK